ncbi:hypothetical protein [Paractinoplanes brasiliensis]|nr:hypothetical protein [Actinoplanes brasiliensis]
MPSQQQPVDIDVTPSGTVVEFGPEQPDRHRRWDFSALGRELLADRRTVPVAAALAALAALVSMLSEWQVTTIDAGTIGSDSGERLLASGIDDLGALGVGYVLGLFLIVPSVVLTLFGPPSSRRTFRLAGLSVAGTVFGVVLAAAARASSQSYVIDPVYRIALDDAETTLAYGRGLWCALAAVLFASASLYLAGRHLPGSPAAEGAPQETTAEVPPEATWSWRRPSAGRDDLPEGEALDLTVSPSQPFTSLHDDRDRPS